MDKKQFEEAVLRRKRVKAKEGGKTVFGIPVKVVGTVGTIRKDGGQLILKHIWEIELAD